MAPAEEPLAGRTLTDAVRVGQTLRRPSKPSSATVQGLLRHLRHAGFDGCPEPLGFDDQGRDVLSYVEGDGGSIPLRPETVPDTALVDHARLIRRFHDATATALPATGLADSGLADSGTWDPLLRDPAGVSEVVCHNDLSIPNTVYRGGRPCALIDFEFAAPGRRLWDLAYAAWWLVPLHRPEFMDRIGWPPVDPPRRLGLLVDAYGLGDGNGRALLLDVLRERQLRNQAQLRSWVAAGVIAAYDESDRAVECGQTLYVESIRSVLEAALGLR
jgi:hypothetical protein